MNGKILTVASCAVLGLFLQASEGRAVGSKGKQAEEFAGSAVPPAAVQQELEAVRQKVVETKMLLANVVETVKNLKHDDPNATPGPEGPWYKPENVDRLKVELGALNLDNELQAYQNLAAGKAQAENALTAERQKMAAVTAALAPAGLDMTDAGTAASNAAAKIVELVAELDTAKRDFANIVNALKTSPLATQLQIDDNTFSNAPAFLANLGTLNFSGDPAAQTAVTERDGLLAALDNAADHTEATTRIDRLKQDSTALATARLALNGAENAANPLFTALSISVTDDLEADLNNAVTSLTTLKTEHDVAKQSLDTIKQIIETLPKSRKITPVGLSRIRALLGLAP